MHNAIIASDNHLLASAIESRLHELNWTSKALSVGQAMANSSHSLDGTCGIVVIDAGFLARYGSVVSEMGQFFSNVADRMPLYLIFENQTHPTFRNWLGVAKRRFQLDGNLPKLPSVVAEITQVESGIVDASGYVSPMSAI